MSLQRNGLLLILLTGLLGILGQWDVALARLWALPAALALAGLAYEAAMVRRRGVRVTLIGPQRWPLGRARKVAVAFTQSECARLRMQTVLSAPESFAIDVRVLALSLSRGRETRIELPATARRLGHFDWPRPRLRVAGPLQLAWWPVSTTAEYTATVIPDLLGQAGRATGERPDGGRATHLAGASAEIVQLRDYRHADPLHAIDWKASARRGRVISREFAAERCLEVLLAVDVGRAGALAAGEIDRLGLYVNVAARLAQRAVEFDDSVGLLLFAQRPLRQLAPARGAAAVARIRALLAECAVHPGQGNPALAAAHIRATHPRRMLVIMLTDLLDAASEELSEAIRLLTPKHLTLVCGLENPLLAGRASAPARDPLDPFRALAASEYHRTLEGNVRALRAQGAAALTARPEQLDRAVIDAYHRFRRQRRV